MLIDVTSGPLQEVLPFRELCRREMGGQIVHDSLPGRGFGDLFLIRLDGRVAGYGFVIDYRGEPWDMLREFYVLLALGGLALPMFRRLVEASGARRVEVQTNDVLLSLMIYDCATDITSDTVSFHFELTTILPDPGVVFGGATEADKERIFEHRVDPVGEWLLDRDGAIVATGGIATHYNPPFGDLFMEVDEPCRRQGYGSYLIQELKRARCEIAQGPGGSLQSRECRPTGNVPVSGALLARPIAER